MSVSTMMCVHFGYKRFVVAWRVAGEACSCSHLQTFLHHLQKGKGFKVGILIVYYTGPLSRCMLADMGTNCSTNREL